MSDLAAAYLLASMPWLGGAVGALAGPRGVIMAECGVCVGLLAGLAASL